jgi:hypothetical protein
MPCSVVQRKSGVMRSDVMALRWGSGILGEMREGEWDWGVRIRKWDGIRMGL